MESFNNNLQGGKKLVKALEKQTVRRAPASTSVAPVPRAPAADVRCSNILAQPVSVLQAPATPAMVAAGATDDAPTLLVGGSCSNATSARRVINASE